jgi:hypothetical protein
MYLCEQVHASVCVCMCSRAHVSERGYIYVRVCIYVHGMSACVHARAWYVRVCTYLCVVVKGQIRVGVCTYVCVCECARTS